MSGKLPRAPCLARWPRVRECACHSGVRSGGRYWRAVHDHCGSAFVTLSTNDLLLHTSTLRVGPLPGALPDDRSSEDCKPAMARAGENAERSRCVAQDDDPTFPRVTPHDLRHTAAGLAVQAGVHVKVVQRMLGHASAAMTLDVYADLFDDDLDAVATALDQAKRAASVVIRCHERGIARPERPAIPCPDWCPRLESNQRPLVPETNALSPELRRRTDRGYHQPAAAPCRVRGRSAPRRAGHRPRHPSRRSSGQRLGEPGREIARGRRWRGGRGRSPVSMTVERSSRG